MKPQLKTHDLGILFIYVYHSYLGVSPKLYNNEDDGMLFFMMIFPLLRAPKLLTIVICRHASKAKIRIMHNANVIEERYACAETRRDVSGKHWEEGGPSRAGQVYLRYGKHCNERGNEQPECQFTLPRCREIT